MDDKIMRISKAMKSDPNISMAEVQMLGEMLQQDASGSQCKGCGNNQMLEARIAELEKKITGGRQGGTMSTGDIEKGIQASYQGATPGRGGIIELDTATFDPNGTEPAENKTDDSKGSSVILRPRSEDEEGKLVGQQLCSVVAIADDNLTDSLLSIRANLKVNGRDAGALFDVPLAYFNVDAEGNLRRYPIGQTLTTYGQPVSIELELTQDLGLGAVGTVDVVLEAGEQCQGYGT